MALNAVMMFFTSISKYSLLGGSFSPSLIRSISSSVKVFPSMAVVACAPLINEIRINSL